MSEPFEFVFVPRKLSVRDSVTQIGNNISKSEASIQSRTALNAGEMETSVTDKLEAVQQREHRTGTSSRRRCQYQEGKEARECCNNTQNNANRCFCTAILFKSQDWHSTGHGSADFARACLGRSADSACAHFNRCADVVRTYTDLV